MGCRGRQQPEVSRAVQCEASLGKKIDMNKGLKNLERLGKEDGSQGRFALRGDKSHAQLLSRTRGLNTGS